MGQLPVPSPSCSLLPPSGPSGKAVLVGDPCRKERWAQGTAGTVHGAVAPEQRLPPFCDPAPGPQQWKPRPWPRPLRLPPCPACPQAPPSSPLASGRSQGLRRAGRTQPGRALTCRGWPRTSTLRQAEGWGWPRVSPCGTHKPSPWGLAVAFSWKQLQLGIVRGKGTEEGTQTPLDAGMWSSTQCCSHPGWEPQGSIPLLWVGVKKSQSQLACLGVTEVGSSPRVQQGSGQMDTQWGHTKGHHRATHQNPGCQSSAPPGTSPSCEPHSRSSDLWGHGRGYHRDGHLHTTNMSPYMPWLRVGWELTKGKGRGQEVAPLSWDAPVAAGE